MAGVAASSSAALAEMGKGSVWCSNPSLREVQNRLDNGLDDEMRSVARRDGRLAAVQMFWRKTSGG